MIRCDSPFFKLLSFLMLKVYKTRLHPGTSPE